MNPFLATRSQAQVINQLLCTIITFQADTNCKMDDLE